MLDDLGIKYDQSARAQKLAVLPAKAIREYIARQREAADEVTKAGVLRLATREFKGTAIEALAFV